MGLDEVSWGEDPEGMKRQTQDCSRRNRTTQRPGRRGGAARSLRSSSQGSKAVALKWWPGCHSIIALALLEMQKVRPHPGPPALGALE